MENPETCPACGAWKAHNEPACRDCKPHACGLPGGCSDCPHSGQGWR